MEMQLVFDIKKLTLYCARAVGSLLQTTTIEWISHIFSEEMTVEF